MNASGNSGMNDVTMAIIELYSLCFFSVIFNTNAQREHDFKREISCMISMKILNIEKFDT